MSHADDSLYGMSDDLVAQCRQAFKDAMYDRIDEPVARLSGAVGALMDALEAKDARIAALTADGDAALRRAEEAERDARRYRWLRDPPAGRHEQMCVCASDEALFCEKLDAAIDSAIAQEQP